ncbi:hypothetical protein H9Y04_35535 [Streptomyces sp. TRM66268-LWL]|uniref:Uncharacterized protein n=1 Tax=Streptomyces polyasparticus TaxID=2767826 RepID=A0ABR7SR47_9ACTN|nr:hypothetical protein [Streptomyces polyasparticus]MBC9717858.1 hypothetical protein [Streptomyces polyasparticus]
MTTLLRAPKECGSWFWDLEETAPTGIASALTVASNMVRVLQRHDLLTPRRLEYDWYMSGSGHTGVRSTLLLFTPLDDHELPEKVLGSRPAAFPSAEIQEIRVIGSGEWIDADGVLRTEPQLVDLSVTTDEFGPMASVSVHHDVWNWFDFTGNPHPQVQRKNAPRLAEALAELNSLLGVEADPGESTYFGSAVGLGVSTPDADENGLGPNLTDKL